MLSDKNYLTRGLALYESLIKYASDFHLFMLATDDEGYDLLKRLDLNKVTVLGMRDVEDNRMLAVKPTRTHTEYMWMFSSCLPVAVLAKHPEFESITYIDTDMYFYSSLEPLYEEFEKGSVLIIPHNFSRRNKHKEEQSGIYNVGMMMFRNDKNGRECLYWWRNRVIEWCFNRYEDGKYGDQLYLNDWPSRFQNVIVSKNLGADMAPWNMDRFTIRYHGKDSFEVRDCESLQVFPLIFYHYHALRFYFDSHLKPHAYPISVFNKTLYRHYLSRLRIAYKKVWTIEPDWKYGNVPQLDILTKLKQYISKWRRK